MSKWYRLPVLNDINMGTFFVQIRYRLLTFSVPVQDRFYPQIPVPYRYRTGYIRYQYRFPFSPFFGAGTGIYG
ncbi:hypothetical protein HanRHA438_Chr09g0408371 [Helianthus annuus]|nr:hypothetical protein HanIR_Chr09g0427491 [Helianthus annuus]KAJ0889016.1 hypothetical protein HanRHA438_Chr09g0408371 [Helianthus annuus]